jgi:hypothetical protein
MRFLISHGDTRTLLRRKLGDNSVEAVAVTRCVEPLSTTIDEGIRYHRKKVCEREEDWDVMCEVAPELKNHSCDAGGFSVDVLKFEARAVEFHVRLRGCRQSWPV